MLDWVLRSGSLKLNACSEPLEMAEAAALAHAEVESKPQSIGTYSAPDTTLPPALAAQL